MPNSAPHPWRMFLPLAIVLLLALLWTTYWFVASGIARDRLEEERTRWAAKGLTLACTRETWGGYPFHFEFSCTSPVVTLADRAESRSGDLLLVALAYAPWQVAALVDGPTTFLAAGIAPLEMTHQRALAAVTFDKDWQPSFSADIPAISVPGLGQADKVILFTRPAAADGTDISLRGQNIIYRPEGNPEVTIDDASFVGTLLADNSVRIDKSELRQGQLRTWGSGVLSLDPEHRIAGEIEAETTDMRALFALLAPQLGLSESNLANFQTMLGLMGNGTKVPIIARDGALYVGPLKAADLPPLY
jgi:hypothetical protein